jgi:CRISPR-associated protein Csx17
MTVELQSRLRLGGARADSLLGYLKAIATLRLFSTQMDNTVRAAWERGALTLHEVSRDRLVNFFIEEYAPTPVLNPWNSGAGFDAKSRTQEAGKTLDRLNAQPHARWRSYQETLRRARGIVSEFGDMDEKGAKQQIVTRLRATLSDAAIEWIDAAVLIGKEHLGFPILLGTGGNDGRLDFSINFLQRLLDVVGTEALATREQLFLDAVEGTSNAALSKGILGQYQLGAGGYNNPWDLVLAIEGAIAFAGSITRRFASDGDRPSAPFQFVSTAVGYAAASNEEEDRGELWLPQWRGAATYPAIRSLLRNGRVQLLTPQPGATKGIRVFGASSAADSIAAVQAAQTLGVSSGIASFGRIVVAQRNGLAFGATYVGQIAVDDRPEIAALSRDVRTWVTRVSRLELGAAARAALREYQEGIVAYAGRPSREAFIAMLASLADLDDSVASKKDLRPLPWLQTSLHHDIDAMKDESIEDRLARSSTSVGWRQQARRLRYRISRVAFDERTNKESYDAAAKPLWRFGVADTCTALLARAVREAAVAPTDETNGFAAHFGGSIGLPIDDFARLVAGEINWSRLKQRLRAYSIIEPYAWPRAASRTEIKTGAEPGARARIPVAFAALKTLMHGYLRRGEDGAPLPEVHGTFLDAETAVQLVANTDILRSRALAGAYARLRSAGADVRDFHSITIDRDRVAAYAVALMTPAGRATREALWRRCRLNDIDGRDGAGASLELKEKK